MDLPEHLHVFGSDLTQSAREGSLAPLIGREKVLARVMEILGRAAKNNPVLVGEAGVGKTAIVEGLAQMMVNPQCPSWLREKILFSLDLASLVAGTKNRGDFEGRLKSLADTIRLEKGRIIVFIDEIHLLINLGKNDASVDAANFLKPMLARGDFRCVGATTFDEFRLIEKDPALTRRFLVVKVDEPGRDETLAILRGLRHRYERFHGVRIQNEALAAAAGLSDRYIGERRQPDKAIDLVDESCAYLRSILELPPPQIREWESVLNQLRLQEDGLRREGGDELVRVRAEIKRLEKERANALRIWEIKREQHRRLGELLRERDQLAEAADAAEKALDLRMVVHLRTGRLAQIQGEMDSLRFEASPPEVTPQLVAEVIARATGIDLAKVSSDIPGKLKRLESKLNARVIGQGVAVCELVNYLARSYAGLNNPKRPLLSVLLAGDHGVGKTELGRALAEELCDGALVEIDLSEYSDRGSVARLIGAPPGYIGYEQGGQLTEKVRRRPYCVVLFDEVDKAHPEVLQVIQSVVEKGVLTDSAGREVSFRHALLVVTTAFTSSGPGPHNREALIAQLHQTLQGNLAKLVDLAVVLGSLKESDHEALIDGIIEGLNRRLPSAKRVVMESAAKRWLVNQAYASGNARSVLTIFREQVENKIARKLLDQPRAQEWVVCYAADAGVSVVARRAHSLAMPTAVADSSMGEVASSRLFVSATPVLASP